MQVFVTGGTGFIGSELVRQLVAAGHDVTGLARTPENARRLEGMGASAIVGDVRTPAVLREGVKDADAVAHLALPRAGEKDRKTASDVWNRGTRGILNACREVSLRSFVFASGAIGMYRHGPGEWIDETAPEAPTLSSMRERWTLDNLVRAAHREWGLPATILRPPIVYGPDGAFREFFLDLMRRGFFRVPGDGLYFVNFVNVEDCAAAYRLALERPPSGETYLVVDEEPLTMRAFADLLATAMGRRRPGTIPPFVAKLVAGRDAVEAMMESVRLRNQKIKEQLGWAPRYPSTRDGIPATVRAYLGTHELAEKGLGGRKVG
ncbi:MAG TPA: NAD(P)-dependent oxidoreductase [Thermoplasmata archaeon]|nr:NAD(P)-dependent oxidoreductase [Thermoplasmata archaeon]